jgi:hypothetical protein
MISLRQGGSIEHRWRRRLQGGKAVQMEKNMMGLRSALRNARDVIRTGPVHFNLPLLRTELLVDHRASKRRFFAEMLPKGGIGAEIGVFTGLFSVVLLEVTKPKLAYFVDPWWKAFGPNYPDWGDYTDHGRLSASVAYETAVKRIKSHAGTSKTEVRVECSAEFYESIPDGHFDWVYVDAGHTYDGMVSELAALRSKMKSGGIISGDDWTEDPTHYHHGIAKAVSEAVDSGEFERIGTYPLIIQWAIRAP